MIKRAIRLLVLITAVAVPTLATSGATAASGGQLCSGLPGRCLRISFNNDSRDVPIVVGNDTPGPAENLDEVSVGSNKWVYQFIDEGTVYCVGVSAGLDLVTKDCSGPDPVAYGTVWNRGDNGLKVNQRVSGQGNGQYVMFVSRTTGDRATLVPNSPAWTAGNGGTSFRFCFNSC